MNIGVDQRRARLARRHLLAAKGATARDAAEAMVALHATDPATVHLAIVARQRVPDGPGIERALYEDRDIVRMLGMRRTMFVVPADLVPVVQEACTRDVAARLRRGLVQHLEQSAGMTGAWLAEVEDAVAAALSARGSATAAELAVDEPRLRTELVYAPDKSYGGKAFITTRVLGLLAAEGRIVRGRPRGSWLSGQYSWSMLEDWLPGRADWSAEAARAELARRWLATFGPAPVSDLRWWTGWTAGQTKKALAEIGPVEVDLDGVAGIVLADDLEPDPDPGPWVALLPGLDSTPMGWQSREWYLGGHAPALFDRWGNVGPTVWSDGRIVGGWAQRRSGEVVVEVLEDVGGEAVAAIESQAARLTEWLGDVRVTPRFRTPLERKLSE